MKNRAMRKKAEAEKQKRTEEKRKAIPDVLRRDADAAEAIAPSRPEWMNQGSVIGPPVQAMGRGLRPSPNDGPVLGGEDDLPPPLSTGAGTEVSPGPFEVREIADTDLPPAIDPEPPAIDASEHRLLALKRKIGEAQDLVWRGGSARARSELLTRQGHVLIWEAGTAHDFDALVQGLPRPLTIFLADGVTMPATEISLAGVSIFGGG